MMGLDARLRLARLAVETDLRSEQGDLPDLLRELLRGGVDLVVLRDAAASSQQLATALDTARALANQTGGLVALADDLAAAQQAQADLVHLTEGPDHGHRTPVDRARQALHAFGLLGATATDEHQLATQLTTQGVDYLFVGQTAGARDARSHDHALDLVRAAAGQLTPGQTGGTPWFAAGASPQRLDGLLQAGARRVVAGTAVTHADDPQAVAQELADRLRAAWDSDPAMEEYRLHAVPGGNLSFPDPA